MTTNECERCGDPLTWPERQARTTRCVDCQEWDKRDPKISRVTAERDALLGLLGDRQAVARLLCNADGLFYVRLGHCDGLAMADALRAEAVRRVAPAAPPQAQGREEGR